MIESLHQKFNVQQILACLPDMLESEEFLLHKQLSITHSSVSTSWFDGVGSLYDYQTNKFTKKTEDYIYLNEHFKNSYLESAINNVKDVATSENILIGRIRLMLLTPKSCYTLHQDLEEYRYHIPLTSNDKCFFVVSDKIYRMKQNGMLYKFYTKDLHTAVNASNENRLHLVFDTFR